MANQKILITGGVRSGKSRHALVLAQRRKGRKVFLATAQGIDEEMKARIKKHKQERSSDFVTIEEPLYLAKAFKKISPDVDLVLIDCMTLWMHNLMHSFAKDERKLKKEVEDFLKVLKVAKCNVIIVTNEVGCGIVPINALARAYVDKLGFLNQRLAEISDEVILMTCGLPQIIK